MTNSDPPFIILKKESAPVTPVVAGQQEHQNFSRVYVARSFPLSVRYPGLAFPCGNKSGSAKLLDPACRPQGGSESVHRSADAQCVLLRIISDALVLAASTVRKR